MLSRRRVWTIAILSIIVAGVSIVALGGSLTTRPPTEELGALVSVQANSQVGVLLDEIPFSERNRVSDYLISKDTGFWTERAKDQVRLMTYRLVFRDAFYDESEGKGALPLPPEQVWNIQLGGSPQRTTVGNHDIILVGYTFTSTLLTDIESPGISEPSLESIGGKWEEPFILPMDPELLFQRTGFACMDEDQFPPHSVDAEEVDTFYDQEMEPSSEGHYSEIPEMSCPDALDELTGKIETSLVFERLPWDSGLADKVRVGEITDPAAPDLVVEESAFRVNRLVYRYIGPDSCSVAEGSVEGTGWRRLLQFGAADRNFGGRTLEIGDVDYFIEGSGTELSSRGIYEYSPCHNHYHFKHYGSFTFGDAVTNHKMGFCLQSTNRFSNNEQSPLQNRYSGCDFQGIEAGWVDEYKIGLDNQWIDVTAVDTTKAPRTEKLSFHSNPDGFLCEGTPVLDAEGNQLYEPTEFKTDDGQTVYRPKCDFGGSALENNIHSYEVTLPTDGNGYVTDDCRKGEIGPLRNCGFHTPLNNAGVYNCTPGQQVLLSLTIPQGAAPQVVRVCDYSSVLGTGIPCTYNGPYNAKSLANGVVVAGLTSEVTFACPAELDENEKGGKFSLYFSPLLPDDPPAVVSVKVA